MSKIAVVYYSMTGNTEAMAQYVAEGVKAAGATVATFTSDSFTAAAVADYDAIAFGCPAMGAEQLESDEFEPMFEACKPVLGTKPIALFGSYGWGTGEWMDIWAADCAGLNLVKTVICNEDPDDEAAEACRQLGTALA